MIDQKPQTFEEWRASHNIDPLQGAIAKCAWNAAQAALRERLEGLIKGWRNMDWSGEEGYQSTIRCAEQLQAALEETK